MNPQQRRQQQPQEEQQRGGGPMPRNTKESFAASVTSARRATTTATTDNKIKQQLGGDLPSEPTSSSANFQTTLHAKANYKVLGTFEGKKSLTPPSPLPYEETTKVPKASMENEEEEENAQDEVDTTALSMEAKEDMPATPHPLPYQESKVTNISEEKEQKEEDTQDNDDTTDLSRQATQQDIEDDVPTTMPPRKAKNVDEILMHTEELVEDVLDEMLMWQDENDDHAEKDFDDKTEMAYE